jgi:hypothetical protein
VSVAGRTVARFRVVVAETTAGTADVNVTSAGGTAWGSGAITAGSIATDAITNAEVATGALVAGTEISGLLAAADIQTECEDALEAYRLDELLSADSDIDGAAPPTVGSVFHEALTKTPGSFTYDQVTDSTEALRDNMGTSGAGLTDIDLPNQTMDITSTLSSAVTLAADQSAVTALGGATTVVTLKKIVVENSDAGGSAVSLTGSGTGNSHGLVINSTAGKGVAIGSAGGVGMSIDGAGATDFQVGGVSANFTAWNATLQADTAYDATTVNGVLETTFATPTP